MQYMLLLPILLPITASLILFAFPKTGRKLRNGFVLAILAATFAAATACAFCCDGAFDIVAVTEKLRFTLFIDDVSRLFSVLTSAIWLIVGIYAFGYMTHEENENTFFGFMLLTLGILTALDYAANVITMYLFFELATLASVPLVLNSLKKEAVSAALKYLFYSIAGAFAALFGIFIVYKYCPDVSFLTAGNIPADSEGHEILLVGVMLMIVGFGTKAGMYPMHGWLPSAHPVAPSPASALLSGLIAKAGILAVLRTVYFTVGYKFIQGTWVQLVWIILALITVFMGSMMAYREKQIKKRLAYSTVSQISYIMLALALCDPTAFAGGLMHVVFHAVIKCTLFMCAGSIIFSTGITDVTQLDGIGKRMPVTVWGWTLASLGLIGIPPASGFVSKWFIASGALQSGEGAIKYIAPAILLVSALLTAGYLLPVTIKGFFPREGFSAEKCETKPVMYLPVIILAVISVLLGCFTQPLTQFVSGIAAALFS